MSVPNVPNPQAIPLNFEQAYSELENIVAQMESGQMPLEASLAAYARGSFLLQYCQNALTEVEQQVQILNERNQLTPFDDENV
jgi:exodeoxyribonuclease VII small subunit